MPLWSPDPSAALSRPAVHRRPDEGETVSANGIRYTFTLGGADTADAYDLMEVTISPGPGPPAHAHSSYEESFTVLEGELTLQGEGQTIRALAGACVNIPRGAAHSFKNTGAVPARILTLAVPAGMEAYFRAACHPVAAGPGSPLPPAPEDRRQMLAPGEQYGIHFLEPHPNPLHENPRCRSHRTHGPGNRRPRPTPPTMKSPRWRATPPGPVCRRRPAWRRAMCSTPPAWSAPAPVSRRWSVPWVPP